MSNSMPPSDDLGPMLDKPTAPQPPRTGLRRRQMKMKMKDPGRSAKKTEGFQFRINRPLPTRSGYRLQKKPNKALHSHFFLVSLPAGVIGERPRWATRRLEPTVRYLSPSIPPGDTYPDITIDSLSRILVDNKEEPVALNKDIKADRWDPVLQVIEVETSPGCWDEIAALLVNKDLGLFRAGIHGEWIQRIRKKIVKEWTTLTTETLGNAERGTRGDELSQRCISGLRGRMRRRSRRHGHDPKGTFLAQQIPVPVADGQRQQSSTTTVISDCVSAPRNPGRGRLRRRIRRQIATNSRISIATNTLSSSIKVEEQQALSNRLEYDWTFTLDDFSQLWRARSINLQIGASPRSLEISWEKVHGPTLTVHRPVITLSHHDSAEGCEGLHRDWLLLRESKSDHAMSAKPDRYLPHLAADMDPRLLVEEEDIIAHVKDHADVIRKPGDPLPTALYRSYGLIRSISGDTSLPELSDTIGFHEYWKRLQRLLIGATRRGRLPFSKGYSLIHRNPLLFRRPWRYGLLDVDSPPVSSQLPKWRATWTSEKFPHIPACEFPSHQSIDGDVQHNVESCRNFGMDQAMEPYPWHSSLRNLPKPSFFTHWPVEYFRCGAGRFFQDWSFLFGEYKKAEIQELALSHINRAERRIWAKASDDLDLKPFGNVFAVPFQKALISLMGFGAPRNTTHGLELVVRAADRGCLRSMSLTKRLFDIYHQPLYRDAGAIRKWLLEGALRGSPVAFEDLEQAYPDSDEYRLAEEHVRFTFNHQRPKTLNYRTHVLAHFDLSDVASLRQLVLESQGPDLPKRKQAWDQLNTVFLNDESEEVGVPFSYGSILHMACLFNFPEAAKILLDAGLDINAKNSMQQLRTPILCALRRGHHQIAKMIVETAIHKGHQIEWFTSMHYLVYIANDDAAVELAELFARNGAQVNDLCDSKVLDSSDLWPLEDSLSVTPLRWAVMHGKAKLARELVDLGARFATSRLWASDSSGKGGWTACLLLETPCTNLEILNLFFEELDSHKLPYEFSETPLGLLVSEDDTAERRLRRGFGDMGQIIAALELLLQLQPGYEECLLWSVVRHNHVALAQFLIMQRHWAVGSRYKGLSCLHTAVLYGHRDMVSFLVSQGADAEALTSRRRLNCFHLLSLVPRDKQTDLDILDMILNAPGSNINANGLESFDNLTPLHLAVRNRKLHLVKALLDLNADPLIPVTDQIGLLSTGRSGIFKSSPGEPIVKDTTILGEVLLQCNQDAFYSLKYAEKLLRLILFHRSATNPLQLYLDSARSITIVHILAILGFRHPHRIFKLVLRRIPRAFIDRPDLNGDTPLHYACLSGQDKNVRALVHFGANPLIKNSLHWTPMQSTIFGSIVLGPLACGFEEIRPEKSLNLENHRFEYYIDGHASQGARRRKVLDILEERSGEGPHPLRELAIAWSHRRQPSKRQPYALVPLEIHDASHRDRTTQANDDVVRATVKSTGSESIMWFDAGRNHTPSVPRYHTESKIAWGM